MKTKSRFKLHNNLSLESFKLKSFSWPLVKSILRATRMIVCSDMCVLETPKWNKLHCFFALRLVGCIKCASCMELRPNEGAPDNGRCFYSRDGEGSPKYFTIICRGCRISWMYMSSISSVELREFWQSTWQVLHTSIQLLCDHLALLCSWILPHTSHILKFPLVLHGRDGLETILPLSLMAKH